MSPARGRQPRPRPPTPPRATAIAAGVLTLLALFAPAACTPQAARTARGDPLAAAPRVELATRSAAALPADLVGPYFYVEARATSGPESAPVTLILDTGAQQTVIDAAAAGRLFPGRVRPSQIRVVSADGLRADTAGVLTLDTLDAGPVRAEGVTALIVDLGPVLGELRRQTGRRAHGLLGWDVLSALALELDYPARRARVEPSPASPAPNAQALIAAPLPTVEIDMPDGRRRFTIDTGAAAALQMPVIRRLPLRSPPARLGDAQSITGVTPAVGARLRGSIRFGGATIADPMVERTNGQARLGAGLLNRGVLTIDPAAGRVRFEVTQPSAP